MEEVNGLCKSFVGSVSTVAEGKHRCVSIAKLMGRLVIASRYGGMLGADHGKGGIVRWLC